MVTADARPAVPALRAAADVLTADGARLRSYGAGRPGRPAIVLASACGMPAGLCARWLHRLAAEHHVLTWETRGMFGDLGPPAEFDRLGHDVAAQTADLVAVLDHHGVAAAHVMGLCGGAVIALHAAAGHPARVRSLSLWHGDFSGSPWPTTSHQDDLRALLAMALRSRDDAAAINAALRQSATAALPAELAGLVGYPYRSAELFYRYCVLTAATMTTDVTGLLAAIAQPCLVVTSEDDRTADPAGSRRVAAALPNAVLRVQPHGDHLSAFAAGERLRRWLADFLAGQAEPAGRAALTGRGGRRDG